MKDYLNSFDHITLDLQEVDVMIEDDDEALILLYFLPSTYKNFIDIMLYGLTRIKITSLMAIMSDN